MDKNAHLRKAESDVERIVKAQDLHAGVRLAPESYPQSGSKIEQHEEQKDFYPYDNAK